MAITLQDIVDPKAYENNSSGNADLTDHYFDVKQKEFKIFRFNHHIYAVRYDLQSKQPIHFIALWTSNKKTGEKQLDSKQSESKLPLLGKGNEGSVFLASPEKVIKMLTIGHFNRKIKNKEGATSTTANTKILKQLFLLDEYHIDKYFVMGLWRNPANKNHTYQQKFNLVMPLVKQVDYGYEDPVQMEKYNNDLEEFIMALKIINDLDYCHPDYGTLELGSYYNEIYTQEGIKLIDLDTGLRDLKEANQDSRVAGKDQWLYVYNYKTHNPKDKAWIEAIQNWYSDNVGKSLSENLEALKELQANGKIHLPKKLVEEFQLQSTNPSNPEVSSEVTLTEVSDSKKESDLVLFK